MLEIHYQPNLTYRIAWQGAFIFLLLGGASSDGLVSKTVLLLKEASGKPCVFRSFSLASEDFGMAGGWW